MRPLLTAVLAVPITLTLLAFGDTHANVHPACSPSRNASSAGPAGSAARPMMCALVSDSDLAISQGSRWLSIGYLLDDVVSSARAAEIDPRVLLAVLIRESGGVHSLDWLANTPLAWAHRFSIGLANMELSAFREARGYARGAIDFRWNAIESDPAKAVTAAAYLLAKRASQLDPERSANFTDAEYIRIGYRAGYGAMAAAQRTGRYPNGLALFDLAYRTADRLINPATCVPGTPRRDRP
jgi:hypothetical protein